MSALVRYRWVLLAVGALVTAASVQFARKLPFDSGVSEFLPENVPEVKSWLDGLRRFDALNAWLVGLEEPGSSMSIDGLKHVQAVTRKLQEMKSDGVLAVRSVTNVESLREGEDGAVNSELLVKALPTDAASLEALKIRVMGDQKVFGALVSRDLKGYSIVIRADPRKDAADVARAVEQAVESERGPLKAHFFGTPFFTAVIFKHLLAMLPVIAPAFVLLLLGVFIGMTRLPAMVITVLASAGVALLWWLGLLHLFGLGLSASSGNVALALFAIAGGSYARLREGRALSTFLVSMMALVVGCQAVSRMPVAYLASFGASMTAGLIAIALVAILIVAPLIPIASDTPERQSPLQFRVIFCILTIAVGGVLTTRARFLTTPQTMFSAYDEVGETLAFFDDRFGGSDFIQVDFHGDLKDPAVAARLMRFTDLLEGSKQFDDVRSVAQILGFLNHGFGDAFRIPSSHASLANIWFFLEGNGDVRNLVTDKRDEAMVMIRVPSHPKLDISVLTDTVIAAAAESTEISAHASADRLVAIANASGVALEEKDVHAVINAASKEMSETDRKSLDAQVTTKIREFLASPDSPYQPSDEEWQSLAAALTSGTGDLHARLTAAVAPIEKLTTSGMTARFVATLAEHDADLRLRLRAEMLAAPLGKGHNPPAQFVERAQGAVTDLLDPQKDGGNATILVSGLPVVAPAIESNLKSGLWKALAMLLGAGALLMFLSPKTGVNGILAAATATGLVLIGTRAVGVDIDSGSATLYLLPALLAISLADSGRWSRAFLIAVAAAGLALLFTGALPVTRLGTAMCIGLASVAFALSVFGGGQSKSRPASVAPSL